MSTFDCALRTLVQAERECMPYIDKTVVPVGILRTAIQALKTIRAVQIASNACDEAGRLRLWGLIERELMADAGMEVQR